MTYRPSLSSLRARARVQASQLQARGQQAARDNQRRMEERIRTMTGNGRRALTRAEIEQLGRESARYLRTRMK